MPRVVPILVAALLCGCANQIAIREARLAPLVGQSEGVLVAQMGVPNRTYETGGIKYLAYDDAQQQIATMPPAYPYGPPFWAWYGGGFPPQVVTLTCETTFAVAQGIVRSFVMRGNGCG